MTIVTSGSRHCLELHYLLQACCIWYQVTIFGDNDRIWFPIKWSWPVFLLIFPNWYASDTFVVISCSPLPSEAATYVCTTSLWTAGSVSLRPRCPAFITRPHGVWKRKPVDFTQPLLSDLHWHSHSDDTHFMKHEMWSSLFSSASVLVFPTVYSTSTNSMRLLPLKDETRQPLPCVVLL